MRTFSDQFLREHQAEDERMRKLEEIIRVSGEATAAAIAAGNEGSCRLCLEVSKRIILLSMCVIQYMISVSFICVLFLINEIHFLCRHFLQIF
jgi:hypothetical protein